MDLTLLKFIKVLRHADLPISAADSLTAMQAVALVGYQNRPLLKGALGLTLAKTHSDKETFDYCFDHFFQFLPTTDSNDETLYASKAESDTPPILQNNSGNSQPDHIAGENGEHADTEPGAVSDISAMLLANNASTLQLQIQQAGESVGISEMHSFTQKGQFTRKMLMTMGLPALREDIHQLEQSSQDKQRALAQQLKQYQERLRTDVRNYVEQQFLLYAGREGQKLQRETLKTLSLNRLEQHHYDDMRRLIHLLARRLVKKHSRRQRQNQRGRLDVSSTLRHNLAYDGTLVDIRWRCKHKKMPAVFAICDLSGSVSQYARFFLLFLYSLQEVLPEIRSFVFCSQMGEVTKLFQQHSIASAIEQANQLWGMGGSDYGRAWQDFEQLAMADLRRDTVVLILGDARNNGADPKLEILRDLYQRCGRLVWLNPEPINMWQTGDSEMLRYRSVCHQTQECRTLSQLSDVIDRLLLYR